MGSHRDPAHRKRSAILLAEQGFRVFPVTPDRKAPPLIPEWQHGASSDPDVITSWWTRWETANVAVLCGKTSNLLVLDVDGDQGADSLRRLVQRHGPLPVTAEVKTPHGSHYWFRYPDVHVGPSVSKVAPSVDIRGESSYALAPPSTVSDVRYMAATRAPLAPTPAWVTTSGGPTSLAARRQRAPASEWLAIVDGTDEGARDMNLARLTGHLLRRNVDVLLVLRLVALVNERNRPPLPGAHVDRIVNSIATAELRRRAS
jgi:hypothetical protein